MHQCPTLATPLPLPKIPLECPTLVVSGARIPRYIAEARQKWRESQDNIVDAARRLRPELNSSTRMQQDGVVGR